MHGMFFAFFIVFKAIESGTLSASIFSGGINFSTNTIYVSDISIGHRI